ncbi:hypothetical protein ICE98_00873 [Lactococcus lactis]|nr:hypothetical protein [Lactococcus lactis]
MKKVIKKAAIGMVAFFVVAASGPVFAAVGDQGLTGQNITEFTVILVMLMISLHLVKLAELMAVHSWTKRLIQHK